MTTTKIRWEQPPTRTRRNGNPNRRTWQPLLDRLHDRPGQWACLRDGLTPNGAYGKVSALRRGILKIENPDTYEFRGVKLHDGTGAVYGRYVGK
ncbi:MAG: hypothetical protein ACOYOQ_00450 [Microthrixaceae bacterium]